MTQRTRPSQTRSYSTPPPTAPPIERVSILPATSPTLAAADAAETLQLAPEFSAESPTELPSNPVRSQTKRLPYHVSRTPTNNLPIYSDIKAGKTLKQTLIRKITGDAYVLRDELKKELNLDPERETCEVNAITGHIIIKGWCRPRVERFLSDRGF